MPVAVIKKADITWQQIPGASGGQTELSEAVGTSMSDTIGAGLVRVEDTRLKRKLGYDEILYILSGSMEVETEEAETLVAEEGDFLYLPKGATPTYVWKDQCFMHYTIFPSNWEDLMEDPE